VDDPILRAATHKDLPEISTCARAAYARYVPRIGKEPAPMVADFAALVAAGEVHVLLAAGALVGFIVMRCRAGHLFVENVAVRPDHQGRGFGRRLMAFAEDMARERGQPAVELYTNVKMTENFPFYEGLGFVETERRHENGFDRVYLRKTLT
jgi:ribosomal protein S18 acetylase RimI-like enzyme